MGSYEADAGKGSAEAEPMKFGMGCLLLIAGLALAIPLRGLAISLNWTWFVSPALHLPEISLLQGIGISIFLTVLTAPGMYGPLKLTEGAEKEGSTKAGWDDLFIYGILGPPASNRARVAMAYFHPRRSPVACAIMAYSTLALN
jgi:hypothetical protein